MRHNRQWKKEFDREVDVATSSFEEVCGTCDNFGTKECPFLERATEDTFWKSELRCTKYDN